MNIRLNASDNIVVAYLENLWKTNKQQPVEQQVEQLIKVELTVNEQPIEQPIEQPVEQLIKLELTVNEQHVEQPVEQPIKLELTVNEQQVEQLIKVELTVNEQQVEQLIKVELTVNEQQVEQQVELTVNVKAIPDIPTNNKEEFTKHVKENLKALRDIGFKVYHNISLEKEVNLNPANVNNNEINIVYDFKVASQLTRKMLMKYISKCTIFPKHKSGDIMKPENFRYLVNHHNTIKILDRLWCNEVLIKCGNNVPDINIYKATLIRNFSPNVIKTAIMNTMSTENVVLLDIIRAFDSLEWDTLEELLLANLTRKINVNVAKEFVSQYMTILKNRELYYNNKRVIVSKGISTGLPSSNLVFTLAFEEIIHRWLVTTNYKNDIDFKLNIYVDDIYMKIFQLTKTTEIVTSLISFIETYGLYINKNKSKADKKLELEMPKLNSTDYYLGIPFTRDIELYGELLLKEFQIRHSRKLTWNDMYYILMNKNYTEDQSIVLGFLNYKLRPLIDFDNEQLDREIITTFIKNNYMKNNLCNKINNVFVNIYKFLLSVVMESSYNVISDL